MKKIKVGFFKKPQGMFSIEMIKSIEEKLRQIPGVELYSGLDFREAYILNGNVFVGDFNLNSLDVYFWHDTVKPRDWNGDNFYLNILSVLEKDCIVINTSDSTRIANDKFAAHSMLAKAGLPVADFALVRARDKQGLVQAFSKLGGSVLLKPRFGGWGIGIAKFDQLEDMLSSVEMLLSFLPNENQQILLERYYKNDPEEWVSAVVIGNKAVFGYRKKITEDSSWKIYDPDKKDGKGEKSEYVELSENLKETALRAKQSIGKDIIGFDFIYTEEGYKIIDENGRPGFYDQCFQKSGVNLVSEIVDLIKSKIDIVKN